MNQSTSLADQVKAAVGIPVTPKRTHICMLLDRSGSMWGIVDDTIGGINTFLAEQRKVAGECTFTLVQFDSTDPHEISIRNQAIADVKDLDKTTFVPRGGTPLYDAIGKVIALCDADIAAGTIKPELVVFVVVTDGQENQSREYSKEQAQAAIKSCETKGWQIVYLGVGIDAMAQGGGLGVKAQSTLNVGKSHAGVLCCFAATSQNLAGYRSTGDEKSLHYDAHTRSVQDSAGAVRP